jgi:hypothetical protein
MLNHHWHRGIFNPIFVEMQEKNVVPDDSTSNSTGFHGFLEKNSESANRG